MSAPVNGNGALHDPCPVGTFGFGVWEQGRCVACGTERPARGPLSPFALELLARLDAEEGRRTCACGQPTARGARTCADCSPLGRFLFDRPIATVDA